MSHGCGPSCPSSDDAALYGAYAAAMRTDLLPARTQVRMGVRTQVRTQVRMGVGVEMGTQRLAVQSAQSDASACPDEYGIPNRSCPRYRPCQSGAKKIIE